MICEKKINDMPTLISSLNDLPNNYIFRGHANSSWQLESTLERLLGKSWSVDSAKLFEEYSMNIFKSKYNIYNISEHQPNTKLSWLSVMQHYGVPTRLLDFTESPYIALYFAIETYDLSVNPDFSIYSLDYSRLMEKSKDYINERDCNFHKENKFPDTDKIFENVIDRFSYDIAWVTEPHESNARIDRQAGTFLISGNKKLKIEELLKLDIYSECNVIKFTIKGDLYEQCFALLRKMNINAKTIYGDLSGLGKYIKTELQIHVK
jgi:hypothetical protein